MEQSKVIHFPEKTPLAPALKLWFGDRRIKPVIWDDGTALYLLGRCSCQDCSRTNAIRYRYEDREHHRCCLAIREIEAIAGQR